MKVVGGDIWDYEGKALVVVPTNIGWKKSGENVMGAGLAKQLVGRHPDLPLWYGEFCRANGADTPVVVHEGYGLVMFPTKRLIPQTPWLSWQNKSSMELIERSARQLSELPGEQEIVLPLVGCGNGGLLAEAVLPLLEKYLSGDRFTVVDSYIRRCAIPY